MGLYGFNESEILLFFASLVRVSCLFLLLPIYGDNNIPALVKIFLAFTVNLMVFPLARASTTMAELQPMLNSDMGLIGLAFKEAFVGLVMGFTGKIFFDALSFAFSYMGMQMGFNMAASYDHHTEASTPIISQLIMILATLLFLVMDGHHLFLKAIAQSYEVIPVGGVVISKAAAAYVLEAAAQVFVIAAKLSAPMALMVFLINCAFGVISKAVPQINVLVVSFTVNILAGFLVISLTMPIFGTNMADVFRIMFDRMIDVMKVLA